MNFRNFLSVVAVLVLVPGLRADLLSEVPKAERAELAEGEVVVESKAIAGKPWPELSLYQVVNAPPKVVWDLFTDYKSASTYTPNLIDAKVLTTNPDGSKDVQYTVKVPVLQKISYTVRNTYIRKPNASAVEWTLLKSPLAKSSDGSLRIEPYGKGQTLMCYTNLCVPVTNLVSGLKNQALNEAKATVAAITAEAERRAGNN